MANGDIIYEQDQTTLQKRNARKATTYFRNHPNPKQKLCPTVIQYWKVQREGENYYMTYNSKTGKRELKSIFCPVRQHNWRYKDGIFFRSPTYSYEGLYVEYIKSIDAVEISSLSMDGRRGKDGQKGEWKYRSRRLIFRGDTTAYSNRNGIIGNGTVYEGGKYWSEEIVQFISQCMSAMMNQKEAFKQICRFKGKDDFIAGWKSRIAYDYIEPWILRDYWYKKAFMKREVKKMEYLDYELADVNIPMGTSELAFCTFEVLDENVSVWRIFEDPYYSRYTNVNTDVKEYTRLYFDNRKKGKVFIFNRTADGWERSGNLNCYRKSLMFMSGKDLLCKADALKYIYDLVDISTTTDINSLLDMIRHPVIEQLIKAGYPKTARDLCSDTFIKADINRFFYMKENKKPLFKMLGVNKAIMDMAELDKRPLYFVRNLKDIFGRDDVSDLSKETVTELLPALSYNYDRVKRLVGDVRTWYQVREDKNPREFLSEDERKILIKLCRIANKTTEKELLEVINLYSDARNLEKRIDGDTGIDINRFRTYEDLERNHNALIEIQRLRSLETERQRNARYQEAFDKRQKKRIKDFEEVGEKFSLIVPKELGDITVEGNALSHCVGGYVREHANGNTNILFLRKNGAENVPFYTVEVKDNRLIQIHGSHNKWLGNDPEAIPFMYKWLNDRGITFDEGILLNLGAGYGRSRDALSREYLTA